MPNKKTSSGEGQRKEIYYAALVHHDKRQRKHFSPSLSPSFTSMSLRFKERKNGVGRKSCAIKQSLGSLALLIIVCSGYGRVPEKLLSLCHHLKRAIFFHEMIAPVAGFDLIITGNFPHGAAGEWVGVAVFPLSLYVHGGSYCSLEVVWIPCPNGVSHQPSLSCSPSWL
jgi:hypothetical protein